MIFFSSVCYNGIIAPEAPSRWFFTVLIWRLRKFLILSHALLRYHSPLPYLRGIFAQGPTSWPRLAAPALKHAAGTGATRPRWFSRLSLFKANSFAPLSLGWAEEKEQMKKRKATCNEKRPQNKQMQRIGDERRDEAKQNKTPLWTTVSVLRRIMRYSECWKTSSFASSYQTVLVVANLAGYDWPVCTVFFRLFVLVVSFSLFSLDFYCVCVLR